MNEIVAHAVCVRDQLMWLKWEELDGVYAYTVSVYNLPNITADVDRLPQWGGHFSHQDECNQPITDLPLQWCFIMRPPSIRGIVEPKEK
jgi:hypothetical protein